MGTEGQSPQCDIIKYTHTRMHARTHARTHRTQWETFQKWEFKNVIISER